MSTRKQNIVPIKSPITTKAIGELFVSSNSVFSYALYYLREITIWTAALLKPSYTNPSLPDYHYHL